MSKNSTDVAEAPESAESEELENTDVSTESAEATESVTETNSDKALDVAKLDFSDDAAIQAAYAEADRKGKAAIKSELDKLTKSVIQSATVETGMEAILEAKRLNELKETLRTVPAKSDKVVDYTGLVSARIVALRYAADVLAEGIVGNLPEGVELDIEAIRLATDNLAGSDFTDEMTKMVNEFNSFKWGSTTNRSIKAHVTEWAQSAQSGDFATVQEIRNFVSSEYGTDLPSPGAVAACLFPKSGECTLDCVTPAERTADLPRGAYVR